MPTKKDSRTTAQRRARLTVMGVPISLRDYFASKAMQALIAKDHRHRCTEGATCVDVRELVTGAFDYADAMLAERLK